MTFDAEIEVLRHQNRRLKVALFSTIAVFIVGVAAVSALTAISAKRARALEQQARAQNQAAMAAAQAEFERTEVQQDAKP